MDEMKQSGEKLRSTFNADQTAEEARFSLALQKIAAEHGIESITAIALACELADTLLEYNC